MTKFNNYYQYIIKEASSFSELPRYDESPYGFWIFPNGDFHVVSYQGHEMVGAMVLGEFQKLLEKYESKYGDDWTREDDFLINHGFISMNSHKNTYYAAIGKGINITSRARKTAKDIADFYHMELEYTDYISDF